MIKMMNELFKKKSKVEKMIEKTNITEKELEKLNYKEKQEYYRFKSKLGRVFFVSRDKDGNGITYRKPKENRV